VRDGSDRYDSGMIAEPQCVSYIDVPVKVEDRLSLDGFLSAGMQEGEIELVEEEVPGKCSCSEYHAIPRRY
jgi:hypothetical protein